MQCVTLTVGACLHVSRFGFIILPVIKRSALRIYHVYRYSDKHVIMTESYLVNRVLESSGYSQLEKSLQP